MKTPDDFREFIFAEIKRQGKTIVGLSFEIRKPKETFYAIRNGRMPKLYTIEDILDGLGYSFAIGDEMVGSGEIGERIDVWREENGVQRQEVADMAGISYSAYYTLRTGHNASLRTVLNAANACGIEIGVKSFRREAT